MTTAVSTLVNPFDVPAIIKDRFEFATSRSAEYKAGFKNAIEHRIAKASGRDDRAQLAVNPYFTDPQGQASAQADAWWAGFDDGCQYHRMIVNSFNEAAEGTK